MRLRLISVIICEEFTYIYSHLYVDESIYISFKTPTYISYIFVGTKMIPCTLRCKLNGIIVLFKLFNEESIDRSHVQPYENIRATTAQHLKTIISRNVFNMMLSKCIYCFSKSEISKLVWYSMYIPILKHGNILNSYKLAIWAKVIR